MALIDGGGDRLGIGGTIGNGAAGSIWDRYNALVSGASEAAPKPEPFDPTRYFNNDDGGKPDHFFDINPLDQSKFDADQRQQQLDNDYRNSVFNFNKAKDDRDYALAAGDLDLARQKQASADYWQGQSIKADMAMNAADNAARIGAANISAGATVQAASIAAAADRYAADQRLREGLAGAHNDEQRNRVLLAHEQELASIAKMEDDTKRMIAGRDQQIAGFNAETTRQYQMGDLALKNNQFILDASTNPRDLFGLYFMQRGLTPDWASMQAGNAPVQGEALSVANPMKAYTPNITLPQDFNLGAGAAYGNVGNASNMSLSTNPFLSDVIGGGSSSGGGSGAVATVPQGGGAGGGGFAFNYPSLDFDVPKVAQTPTDINPGGRLGGVPTAALRSGMNLSTVGGTGAMGSDFGAGTAYYDQGKTRAIAPTDKIDPNTQVWIDYAPPARAAYGTDNIARFNAQLASRNNRHQDPYSGMNQQYDSDQRLYGNINYGADNRLYDSTSPNIDINRFNPRDNRWIDFPVPRQNPNALQARPDLGNYQDIAAKLRPMNEPYRQLPVSDWMPGAPQQPGFTTAPKLMTGDAPTQDPFQGGARPEIIENPTGAPLRVKNTWQTAADFGIGQTGGFPRQLNSGDERLFEMPSVKPQQPQGQQSYLGALRQALGTDVSSQYNNLGLGSLYLQGSGNQHLSGMDLPSSMQNLADYGAPIAPSLAASATGRLQPTLNVASAFQQRGGGVLPSLQTLNNQTKGETELFRGYAEGVNGIPWADIVDYLGKPTQNLGQARRSSGGII